MENLRKKTIKGLFWSGVDQFGIYFIRFGFSIWIARLLSPEDYGLIGLMAIFIAVAQMIAESGLQMALIQKKDTDDIDYSTVFWFSLLTGIILYFIIFIFAGEIAKYFNQPVLKPIARVISLDLIIGPFRGIQLVILSKQLDFKKQAKINFVSTFISGTTGVILALKGFAVWALVFQTLIGNIFQSIFLWISTFWKPSFTFNINRFKQLYNYGWKIFLQGLSNAIFTNMYFPLIGKYFSTSDLGFYTRGKRFYDMFIQQAVISYGRVTFPVFSSIQDEEKRFIDAYIKTQRLLILFFIPFTTILIVTAEPFVRFFLTEKWIPAVAYIKLFYLMGLYYPMFTLNQNIFNALGKSELSLKVDILLKIFLFLVLVSTFKLGIKAIIAGQLVTGIFVYFITTFLIKKEINFSITNQLLEFFPVLSISLIIYFLYELIKIYLLNDIVVLSVISVTGPILFLIIFRLFKLKSYDILKQTIFEHIPHKFKFIFY